MQGSVRKPFSFVGLFLQLFFNLLIATRLGFFIHFSIFVFDLSTLDFHNRAKLTILHGESVVEMRIVCLIIKLNSVNVFKHLNLLKSECQISLLGFHASKTFP